MSLIAHNRRRFLFMEQLELLSMWQMVEQEKTNVKKKVQTLWSSFIKVKRPSNKVVGPFVNINGMRKK